MTTLARPATPLSDPALEDAVAEGASRHLDGEDVLPGFRCVLDEVLK